MRKNLISALALFVLAAAPAMAADLGSGQLASVAKQLVSQLSSAPVGVGKSFNIRVAGQVVSITATKNADGTVSIASTKSDEPNPLGVSQITTYVDSSGNVTGFSLSKGDGTAPEVVTISSTGALTVQPVGTPVTAIPGTPVISSTQLASANVPGSSGASSNASSSSSSSSSSGGEKKGDGDGDKKSSSNGDSHGSSSSTSSSSSGTYTGTSLYNQVVVTPIPPTTHNTVVETNTHNASPHDHH